MSVAQFLYSFDVTMKNVDFSSIDNTAAPSPVILKDLHEARSYYEKFPGLNSNSYSCRILMWDLVGKKLQLKLDPGRFASSLGMDKPFVIDKVEVERISFPSGIYPVLDLYNLIHVKLEGYRKAEDFLNWQKNNYPFSSFLSVRLHIGNGKYIKPLSTGKTEMQYLGYYKPLKVTSHG